MKKASKKSPYLTKAITKRAIDKGFKQASRNAMDTAGSVVEVEDGWVVRRYKDGTCTKLKQLPPKAPNAALTQRLASLYE